MCMCVCVCVCVKVDSHSYNFALWARFEPQPAQWQAGTLSTELPSSVCLAVAWHLRPLPSLHNPLSVLEEDLREEPPPLPLPK